MIKTQNLSLSFLEKALFEDLSFHIKRGEHVCLSGVSGKGKSSVLKLVQGFLVPNKGNITINNIELSDNTIQEIRQYIIWIPQNVNLSVNSGKELIQLLELENELDKIESNLVQLGLNKEIINQDFREISGGQKQRIVISICFAINRNIILMDEPTSSLDDQSIQKLISLVNSQKDKTILSASHNLIWLNNAQRIINL
jgi:polar amino acid transport system ATP-binding protein/putative ABC transport system ATP-binding protein